VLARIHFRTSLLEVVTFKTSNPCSSTCLTGKLFHSSIIPANLGFNSTRTWTSFSARRSVSFICGFRIYWLDLSVTVALRHAFIRFILLDLGFKLHPRVYLGTLWSIIFHYRPQIYWPRSSGCNWSHLLRTWFPLNPYAEANYFIRTGMRVHTHSAPKFLFFFVRSSNSLHPMFFADCTITRRTEIMAI
jgi:hypothetical protein